MPVKLLMGGFLTVAAWASSVDTLHLRGFGLALPENADLLSRSALRARGDVDAPLPPSRWTHCWPDTDLRNFGSTACDLLAVASGALDGFIGFSQSP
ncbi:hypothetical protein Pme01_24310 [Planosporangium mesophilum]|uniref:Uncharacterized protein n=1 Tax=Planosporangium mesophilum TaxID=689768 RepID=A0A8J3X0Y9_9ACTN|nr:hypothetical protein Pme01_24310 [Planosporangium mesophilum]